METPVQGVAIRPAPDARVHRGVHSRRLRVLIAGTALMAAAAAAQPPELHSHPSDATVTEPGRVTFTVTADGQMPLHYQWRRDGFDIPGETTDRLTLERAVISNNGAAFEVVISNAAGVTTSQVAVLTVQRDAPRRVMIYYDDVPGPYNYGRLYVNQLRNLLGHFNVDITPRHVADYAAGDMAAHDASFYIGSSFDAPLPEAFLADAANLAQPLVWINYNIWRLLWSTHDVSHLGWTYAGIGHGYDRVDYKAETLFKGTYDFELVLLSTASAEQVLAEAYAVADPGAARQPYVLQASNLWYIADNCLADDIDISRSLVLADLLHDILGTGVATNHRAIVRIEDLNSVYPSAANLAAISALLRNRGIRGAFAVIPRYLAAAGDTSQVPGDIAMTDDPAYRASLEALVQDGHILLVHGYTHTNGEEGEQSGLGYEFWNHQENRPLLDDGWTFATSRILAARNEFLMSGLPSGIWETPHYEASLIAYTAAATLYSDWYERLRPYNLFTEGMSRAQIEAASSPSPAYQTQYLPYTTFKSVYGTRVLPENLNFFSDAWQDVYGNDMTVSNKLIYARQLRGVRDAVASFYFHPTADISILESFLDELEAIGYTFTDAETLLGEMPAGWSPSPPAITRQPEGAAVIEDDPATFAVTATGSAPLAYQWRRDTVPIDGATSDSYTLGITLLTDDGAFFDVVITNAAGSVTSVVALLDVTPVSKVAQPAFTPDAGAFPDDRVPVQVTCATPDVTIRYTTDGSEPTAAHGLVIPNGGTVALAPPAQLIARAFRPEWRDSLLKTALYTVAEPRIRIIAPTNGQTVSGPRVALTATTADSDGVKQIAFFNGITPIAAVSNLPPGTLAGSNTVYWLEATAGGHALTVQATDVLDNTTTSLVIRFQVDIPDPSAYPDGNRWPIPGVIGLENYDQGGWGVGYRDATLGNAGGAFRTDDVDIAGSAGAGYRIIQVEPGEWLGYRVKVQAAGFYTLAFRVASEGPGGTFHLEVDGNDVTGPLGVPDTGGSLQWQTVTITGIHLAAGDQGMRVRFDSAPDGAVGSFSDMRFSHEVRALAPAPGSESGPRPAFSWTPVIGATHYRIHIFRNGSFYQQHWIANAETWTAPTDWPIGSYRWWVQPWASVTGHGSWSPPADFSIPLRRPVLPPLPISPAGSLADTRRPAFSWDAVAQATWYRLYVSRDGSAVLDQWIQGATHYTPGFDLRAGDYRWWVAGWGPDGLGPWSGATAFTLPRRIPGTLNLIAPSGTQDTHHLTYRWDKDAHATWYRLWVGRDGEGTWHDRWYPLTGTGEAAATPGGAHPGPAKPILTAPAGTLASTTPTFQWAGSGATWWLQGWSPDGTGPWSGPEAFIIPYPTGTWCRVYVNHGSATIIDQWTSTGTLPSPVALLPGSHTWWLGVWNKLNGRTLWSDRMEFTVP